MCSIFLVVAVAEVRVTVRFRTMVALPLEDNQAAGIRNRQGAKHHRVNQAEDRCVCADSQRQRNARQSIVKAGDFRSMRQA